MKKLILNFICILLCLLSPALIALNAPDSTSNGPHLVGSGEYKFPATKDADILPDRMTELWAKIYYPKDIATMAEKSPLVIMLHGNHATCGTGSNPRRDSSCEYTDSGMCPDGYVTVPNHEGYSYLADNLASHGFVVVSINANRGINCSFGDEKDSGLNLARGKLILKHLSLLYLWASNGGAPTSIGLRATDLTGKIDFTEVGLFGHSRGGEGVRAAYNLYLDKKSPWPARIPKLHVRAIFEVGAVDKQTSRVLDANGVAWNQLLPMCDGDVQDLEGRYPFERMLLNTEEKRHAQKSLYEVWGANHNFFNTEWQTSDAYGCMSKPIFDREGSGSKEQQTIALASVPAFFRSHLGKNANESFNQNFNPMSPLPTIVTAITQIDRDFTPSPGSSEALVVEDFNLDTGINSSGFHNMAQQLAISHLSLIEDHPQRTAKILWTNASSATYFEAIWAGPGKGRDIHHYATLDFRIARQHLSLNPSETTDFSVLLEDAAGRLSNAVAVSHYGVINGPGNKNPVLKAIRIPLADFTGVDLKKIHGVRFLFNKTESGAIYLANIRVHRDIGVGSENMIDVNSVRYSPANMSVSRPDLFILAGKNSIRINKVNAGLALLPHRPAVEIQVASEEPFPVMDSLPVLTIGNQEFKLSRYSDTKHLRELTFTLTNEQYARIDKNAEVSVKDGRIWLFHSIAK